MAKKANIYTLCHARARLLHPQNARATRATILLVREEERKCRDTDDQIDEILKSRWEAEELHNIPISTHVRSDPYETPVECTNDREDECGNMQSFHTGKR